MSGRARRGHGGGGGGGGGHDTSGSGRWMVSYMDMVTVLMCLFIVLYAISSVDQGKYQELKSSLAEGFGTVEDGIVAQEVDTPGEEAAAGPAGTPAPGDAAQDAPTDLDLAKTEVADLTALRDTMARKLKAHGRSDTVRFSIDEHGLTVRLVSADTFFASSSADLTAEAREILHIVGPALEPTDYQIRVEGNADRRAIIGSIYPTNWELSSARATAVLRDLVEKNGISARRVAAVGYGSARPLARGTSAKALATNRRVDIMVLSSQPESVRALIPGLVSASED